MKFKFTLTVLLTCNFLLISCGKKKDDGNQPTIQSNSPTPENEEDRNAGTNGQSTLSRYKCYSGDINNLALAYEVRRQQTAEGKGYFLYDCQGTNNCQPAFALTKEQNGEGQYSSSCYTGSDGFSLCVSDERLTENTSKGELLHVGTGDGGLVYCSTKIF